MERMAERRGDNLCEGRTQGAGLICGPVPLLQLQPDMVDTGEMAEFVNHGTVLCHHQQQQKAYGFEHLSHFANWRNHHIMTWQS